MTITEMNVILKYVEEIKIDCEYITRRIQILKSNVKAVADALAYEAQKEVAK